MPYKSARYQVEVALPKKLLDYTLENLNYVTTWFFSSS
ncbi:hypothetical protein DSUL_20212 [Desulfovibrionales bacterium]